MGGIYLSSDRDSDLVDKSKRGSLSICLIDLRTSRGWGVLYLAKCLFQKKFEPACRSWRVKLHAVGEYRKLEDDLQRHQQ